ncbi:MAG: SpoIIE family protein phosphatase [Anaerolineales bacterium]|nr:SpoIIE family protein phosphatase [Anaerolineales bacterium]
MAVHNLPRTYTVTTSENPSKTNHYPQSLEVDLSDLAEIGQVIANTPSDLDELAEVAYIEAARLLEMDYFEIGLFEDDLYRTILWVIDGKVMENIEHPIYEVDQAICGWIQHTGQSLLVSSFQEESDKLPASITREGVDPPGSGIFVPLVIGEEIIGVLSVQDRRENIFSKNHKLILTMISNHLAPALALTLLNTEIEFRRRQFLHVEEISRHLISPRPLLERISESISLIATSYDYSRVLLFEYVDGSFLEMVSFPEEDEQSEFDDSLLNFALENETSEIRRLPIDQIGDEGEDTSQYMIEIAVPLIAEKQVLGILQCFQSDSISPSNEQISLMEMIAANLAMTMLEARNFARQQEENWITTVLLEVASHAARPGDVEEALQAVLQLTILLTGKPWSALLVPRGDQLIVGPTAGFGRQIQYRLAEVQVPLEESTTLTDISQEIPSRVQLPATLASIVGAEEAISTPLNDGRTYLGSFLLEGTELPERQLSMISGIANQISLRLENFRLVEEVAARRSLERELETARAIQESFLPTDSPSHHGWEIGANWRVARQVGGDFYDFIPLADGSNGTRWGIVIADVTDKGIPAALYMALCRTLLRSVAISRVDPGQTLTRVNELLFADTQAELFVSAFYAVWEPETGQFSYANAGHNPPLRFLPQERAQILEEHGIILGASLEASYTTHNIQLDPGELVLLYTDGVTEAIDNDGQMFGLHRLENLVLGLESWRAQIIAEKIAHRVADFCGTADLSDDLTIVVLHRP